MRSTLYLILVDREIYSLEIFDPVEFNKWVATTIASEIVLQNRL